MLLDGYLVEELLFFLVLALETALHRVSLQQEHVLLFFRSRDGGAETLASFLQLVIFLCVELVYLGLDGFRTLGHTLLAALLQQFQRLVGLLDECSGLPPSLGSCLSLRLDG